MDWQELTSIKSTCGRLSIICQCYLIHAFSFRDNFSLPAHVRVNGDRENKVFLLPVLRVSFKAEISTGVSYLYRYVNVSFQSCSTSRTFT